MESLILESEQAIAALMNFFVVWGSKLVGAILTLIIGLFLAKKIGNIIGTAMERKQVDPSLRSFVKSLANILLKVLVVVSVLGMVGIQMTSFIAIIGAAGLAVGMALSGTLQNFAGGAMILLFKPFKVGDYIEAQGHAGTVKAIQIFNTILNSPDNKKIIVPNGGLSTSSLVNYSAEPTRRVDWSFGIAYGDDIKKARDLIASLLDSHELVQKDPSPFVRIGELADSSVNFTVRAWVNTADYWTVYFDIIENVYREFGDAGLSIPFPQLDVHLKGKTV